MASYAMDLHNHMPVDAGDYKGPMSTSGRDVVRAALDAGIDVLGVSDHFCMDFFRRVEEAALGTPLLVLPGVEMRLSWKGDEAHLVAMFPPDGAEACFAGLMDAIGYDGSGRAEGLHKVVLEHDPVDVARRIEALGGTCCVAHVDRYFGPYRLLGRRLLERLIDEAPLAAVEFVDRHNVTELGPRAARVACIQSSDSHRVAEIGRRRTLIEASGLSFDAVREALNEALVG